MGLGKGFVKYVIGMLLTATGFISMYIFGGTILGALSLPGFVIEHGTITGAVTYAVESHLPPTSMGQVVGQAIVGAVVAGSLWVIGMLKR